MPFNYESWIKEAQDRLELLHKQRSAIDSEIANLERGIEGFTPLVKSMWAGPDAGITASMRKLFVNEPNRIWYAPAIRDELALMGVRLGQKNPLATIHQILDRMLKSGEIKPYVTDSRTGYVDAAALEGEGSKKLLLKKKKK